MSRDLPPRLAPLFEPAPAVYSIPAGVPFLPALARPIIEAYRDDPFAIGTLTLYLPNRRAVRSLAAVFEQEARRAGRPLPLPRLRAVGDVDEVDLLFSGEIPSAAADLPRAADGLSRRLFLARTVRQRRGSEGRLPSWAASLAAADELCGLLDSFAAEDIPLSRLHSLVAADAVAGAAAHWGRSLDFLKAVTTDWPAFLERTSQAEPGDRRRRMMGALAELLSRGAAERPIIVAGSLGAVRATGALMGAVAQAPLGLVVLPGLDAELDDGAWEKIDPPHPQGLFRERLDRDFGGLPRDQVRTWPEADGGNPARRAFLSLALRPAEATDDWYVRRAAFTAAGGWEAALRGLQIVSARTEDEEAEHIALLIREALEVPGRTVMVVTPDRVLARRIAAKLAAWEVDVDDTGGTPAGGTFRGTFLRLCARWLADPSHPLAFVSMLHHPLCNPSLPGIAKAAFLTAIDRALRGPRPAGDWPGLKAYLEGELTEGDVLAALFAELDPPLAAFAAAGSLGEQLAAHIALAEALAGEDRLWRFEDGEHLARALGDLLDAELLPGHGDEPYPELFEALLTGGAVRKRGRHPRVAIYGLLEARLQSADLTILAGLNDGVWPDSAPTDSFLSRPMRKGLGLPSPEQTIGRAAHDFAQAASMDEVVLTHAARRGRSPAQPSRFLVRMMSLMADQPAEKAADGTARLRGLSAARQRSAAVRPALPPAPRPVALARPRRLSVSDIERLIRDPYAIYAKHVLRLSPLDVMDETPGPKHRGMVLHDIMRRLVLQYADRLPDPFAEALDAIRLDALAAARLPAVYRIHWAPAFTGHAVMAEAFEREARTRGRPVLVEELGEWSLDLGGGESITVRGIPDRIDALTDGRYSVIDFKSKATPDTVKQGAAFNPQTSVLSLMVQEGAFAALAPGLVGQHGFVSLVAEPKGETVFDPRHVVSDPAPEDLLETRKRLVDLLRAYLDPQQPFLSKPRPFLSTDYGDYDHLARRGEWSAEGGDGD